MGCLEEVERTTGSVTVQNRMTQTLGSRLPELPLVLRGLRLRWVQASQPPGLRQPAAAAAEGMRRKAPPRAQRRRLRPGQ